MAINVTHYENVAVLLIKDDLDEDTVAMFQDTAGQCHAQGKHNIVIDGSSLGGLDSAGLEALLELQAKCEENLGALKLCCVEETFAKTLDITRLARRFETFEDLESAVKSFS